LSKIRQAKPRRFLDAFRQSSEYWKPSTSIGFHYPAEAALSDLCNVRHASATINFIKHRRPFSRARGAVFLAAQSGATLNIVTSKAVHGFNS
jgi:hypothetical protein